MFAVAGLLDDGGGGGDSGAVAGEGPWAASLLDPAEQAVDDLCDW